MVVGFYVNDWLVNYGVIGYVIEEVGGDIGDILVYVFMVFVVVGVG